MDYGTASSSKQQLPKRTAKVSPEEATERTSILQSAGSVPRGGHVAVPYMHSVGPVVIMKIPIIPGFFRRKLLEPIACFFDRFRDTTILDAEYLVLREFAASTSVAFDVKSPEHMSCLQELWTLCCTHAPGSSPQGASGSVSGDAVLDQQRWTAFGFQGSEPVRDLRGAGVFGVRMLIHFAKTRPAVFARQLQRCAAAFGGTVPSDPMQKYDTYPLATAALNVSVLVVGMLRLKGGSTRPVSIGAVQAPRRPASSARAAQKLVQCLVKEAADPSDVAHVTFLVGEVFSVAMTVLEYLWGAYGPRSVMEFNAALEQLHDRLVILGRALPSVASLTASYAPAE